MWKARPQMPGPITNAWCFQMLRSKEEYVGTGPASISTRRQGSEPTQRNRRNQETFCGASMGKLTGQRHDEVPKPSRSRSTELLGMLATQIPRAEVPERPVQDTTLGGLRTRVCRGAPHQYHRPLPPQLSETCSDAKRILRATREMLQSRDEKS